VVAMVERLRYGGRRGLLFGNGGFATSNHSILLSRDPWPAGWLPEDFDYQAEADASRDPIPKLDEAYTGPGKIETYTVFYERGGEVRFGVVVGRAADGRRFLAKVPAADDDTIAFLTGGASEPVGSAGMAVAANDGTAHWRIG
ncbi:MAG TPA: hypothetical protein VMB71_14600, partial [Acetobacteraceae bacterium]|nr:hypothetical protein [Acetobacteraceae bacterium]